MIENRGSESLQELTVHWVLPFMERQINLRADILRDVEKSMGYRGVGQLENPITPEEPGDSTPVRWRKGLWQVGWRRVSRTITN
jgi:hypothetical protein